MRIKKTSMFYHCLMQKFFHWYDLGLGRREAIGFLIFAVGAGI
jgi:hypothetical protein